MNLLVDIGNTSIRFGLSENGSVSFLCFIESSEKALMKAIEKLPKEVENIIVSSVVPALSKAISKLAKKLYKKEIILISSLDDSGVNIKIDNPSELGADLLCDLAAAKHLYKLPILIIDAGTATKFLYIDEKNTFFSCAIVPGLELQLSMLSNGTALLPEAKAKEVKPLLDCHNTKDVITSSSFYSHVDMINGIVARYEKEIGHKVNKVITGGNISKIKDLLNFDYELDQDLCLKGIQVIGERRLK